MIKLILTDIEGTTSPINFVKETLFPYSDLHLDKFVHENISNPDVIKALQLVKETIIDEQPNLNNDIDETIYLNYLHKWIKEDRKQGGLKLIQGLIWKLGYQNGELKSLIYPDVVPAFNRWKERGYRIGIYSSGSVQAQKSFYQYTIEGDILGYFSAQYDTEVGGKKVEISYHNIVKDLDMEANEILFLSDVAEELYPAQKVGMQVIQLVREGTVPALDLPTANSFETILP